MHVCGNPLSITVVTRRYGLVKPPVVSAGNASVSGGLSATVRRVESRGSCSCCDRWCSQSHCAQHTVVASYIDSSSSSYGRLHIHNAQLALPGCMCDTNNSTTLWTADCADGGAKTFCSAAAFNKNAMVVTRQEISHPQKNKPPSQPLAK